jgi:hypothetical protein
MPERFPPSTPETPENETTRWLGEELKHYEEIFSFSDEDLRSKRILEIGAFDRRFAAALVSANVSTEVFSLEPALAVESGAEPKKGYARKDILMRLMDRLPEKIRDEVEKHTIVAEAEAIPVADGIYDLVIGKSVPYSSHKQLAKRIIELLRVGRDVRFYPITSDNRGDYESAIRTIKSTPVIIEYKTTTEDDMPMDGGIVHIKEDVLILRKGS